MIKFKYKDKILETPNLIKKLKRMGITESDIEILNEDTPKKEEEPDDIILHKYVKDKSIIFSIHDIQQEYFKDYEKIY